MMRAEMFGLRRDISAVLAELFVALSKSPEEATRLLGKAPSLTASAMAQAETLRAEMLDLRREVAVVMANLLLAAGRSREEVKKIVLSKLKSQSAEGADPRQPE